MPRQWAKNEPFRVLMAASFAPKKGFPDALRALAILAQDTQIDVTIIGDAGDHQDRQQEKAQMLAIIAETGLTDRVRLLGFQPHGRLFEEAYRHHVFLSPSVTAPDGDSEGGAPVTLIEMAATGLPIVSTTHCDIPQVIPHGKGGFLADERAPEQLAAYLRWLVNHPEQWATMGEVLRTHVEAKFDAATQGRNLAALYRELTEMKRDHVR
ncbi:colanic acid biosynthesis glycosyltransferase WcaL [bacterium]|nr:colanic acid biosynthesis glycosyltransferase WcaL [bacterium]